LARLPVRSKLEKRQTGERVTREKDMPNLYVALAHYPVVNKRGEIIASAVTNLDLHDISRAAKTYGVKSFYIVTPLSDQKALVQKIIAHWTDGAGGLYNPARRSALELIRINDSIGDVSEDIRSIEGKYPKTVVTCARKCPAGVSYDKFRNIIKAKNGIPHLLIFGTAWGLSDAFISEADYVLEPITGTTDYNHLSVRSAAAIILDRLLGKEK
jgi:hypothetical protein